MLVYKLIGFLLEFLSKVYNEIKDAFWTTNQEEDKEQNPKPFDSSQEDKSSTYTSRYNNMYKEQIKVLNSIQQKYLQNKQEEQPLEENSFDFISSNDQKKDEIASQNFFSSKEHKKTKIAPQESFQKTDDEELVKDFSLCFRSNKNICSGKKNDYRGTNLYFCELDLERIFKISQLDFPRFIEYYRNDIFDLADSNVKLLDDLASIEQMADIYLSFLECVYLHHQFFNEAKTSTETRNEDLSYKIGPIESKLNEFLFMSDDNKEKHICLGTRHKVILMKDISQLEINERKTIYTIELLHQARSLQSKFEDHLKKQVDELYAKRCAFSTDWILLNIWSSH